MTDETFPIGDESIEIKYIDNEDGSYTPYVEASLSASEAHLGEVGGNSLVVTVTPTITAGAYHANDICGGIQTIANASRVSGKPTILQSLVLSDLAMQSAAFTIFLFSANPGTGTYTDNAECDIDDTDLGLCVGAISSSDGQWLNGKDNGIFVINNIGLIMTPAITSLFAIVKLIGAPTFASTSDLKFKYGFFRE